MEAWRASFSRPSRVEAHKMVWFVKGLGVLQYYKVGHLNTVDPCVSIITNEKKEKGCIHFKWAHNQGQESRYKQMHRFLCGWYNERYG